MSSSHYFSTKGGRTQEIIFVLACSVKTWKFFIELSKLYYSLDFQKR